MSDPRLLSFETKVASFEGTPVRLISGEGIGVNGLPQFECRTCLGKFERSYNNARSQQQYGCQTYECSNAAQNLTPPDAVIQAKLAPLGAVLVGTVLKKSYTYLTVQCGGGCGRLHEVAWTSIQKGNASARCRECALTRKRGPDSHNWKPHLTEEHRLATQHRTVEFVSWSKKVRRMYQHTCVITGQVGGVAAHHFYGFADFPDLRYDVRNGAPLAKRMHNLFHSPEHYGQRGRHTFAQFSEFYEKMTGDPCPIPDPFPGRSDRFLT